MKRILKILIIIIAISGAATFFEFLHFQKEKNRLAETSHDEIASPPKEQISKATTDSPQENIPPNNIKSSSESADGPPPSKYLLEIPFYSQAPFGNWDKVHEEMCEEASVLNAGLYLLNKKLSPDEYEKELMAIKKIEEKLFNDYESTTVIQTKKFTDEYFSGKIKSKIIESPNIENIESEIAAGNPVIVPLAGRDIGNPNFTPPGPVYHMLVIKGYDSINFITNDVGTRKGNSYVYRKEVIIKNIHDWDKTDIHRGAKRVLVLQK